MCDTGVRGPLRRFHRSVRTKPFLLEVMVTSNPSCSKAVACFKSSWEGSSLFKMGVTIEFGEESPSLSPLGGEVVLEALEVVDIGTTFAGGVIESLRPLGTGEEPRLDEGVEEGFDHVEVKVGSIDDA